MENGRRERALDRLGGELAFSCAWPICYNLLGESQHEYGRLCSPLPASVMPLLAKTN